MEFEIWQISESKQGAKNLLFMPLNEKTKLDLSWYKKAYKDRLIILRKVLYNRKYHEEILETIYHIYNVDPPKDYKGRSLSVSDIVVLNNDIYYCQPIGWKRLKKADTKSLLR